MDSCSQPSDSNGHPVTAAQGRRCSFCLYSREGAWPALLKHSPRLLKEKKKTKQNKTTKNQNKTPSFQLYVCISVYTYTSINTTVCCQVIQLTFTNNGKGRKLDMLTQHTNTNLHFYWENMEKVKSFCYNVILSKCEKNRIGVKLLKPEVLMGIILQESEDRKNYFFLQHLHAPVTWDSPEPGVRDSVPLENRVQVQ